MKDIAIIILIVFAVACLVEGNVRDSLSDNLDILMDEVSTLDSQRVREINANREMVRTLCSLLKSRCSLVDKNMINDACYEYEYGLLLEDAEAIKFSKER